MRTIYKFQAPGLLRHATVWEVTMPAGAEIIACQTQPNPAFSYGPPLPLATLWAYVDTDAPLERRMFHAFWTGQPTPNLHGRFTYVGTVQQGAIVSHLFEDAGAEHFEETD